MMADPGPPDHIDPTEAAYLVHCDGEAATARIVARSYRRYLSMKYRLGPTDAIGPDGAIVRPPPKGGSDGA